MKPFRVIDTGIRAGRRQIAFDQALIEAHKAGRIPDTIRFLRFPPTALVGRHQALAGAVDVDVCRRRGIGLGRRITGGGAIYFDEGQLGWELVFHRATLGIADLGGLSRALCEAAAAGLGRLGVMARYRPRSDIEVGGRKVGGTGGFFDGDTLFYQGTVLVDLAPADMAAALGLPAPAADRIVTLKALLGGAPGVDAVKAALLAGFAERLGIAPAAGEITAAEEALAARLHDEEIGTDAFVAGIDDPAARAELRAASRECAGGKITAYARFDGGVLREVLLTGDFFVTPPRTVPDLEAALRNVPLGEVRPAVERFFATANVGILTVAPADFAVAIEAAAVGSS
jgi:lipoate-protein ligase A